MRIRTHLLLATLGLCVGAPAQADYTVLLEVDLNTGKMRRFDDKPGGDALDDLDAALEEATGKTFSSDDFDKVQKAFRRQLGLVRPRTRATRLTFVHPEKRSTSRLKEMRAIAVDTELTIPGCERNFCRAAIAKHLRCYATAVGTGRIRTTDYTIDFGKVTLRTSARDGRPKVMKFTTRQILNAKGKWAALTLLEGAERADRGFVWRVTRTLTRQLDNRRIRYGAAPPVVRRAGNKVTIDLTVRTGRVRFKTEVLTALASGIRAIRKHPIHPAPAVMFRVNVLIFVTRLSRRRYEVAGRHVAGYVDGRVSARDMWSTFIARKRKKGLHLDFSDAEAQRTLPAARRPAHLPRAAAPSRLSPQPERHASVATQGPQIRELGYHAADSIPRR